jgi:MFS family permease
MLFQRGVFAVPDFRRLWLVGFAVSVARWLEMLVVGLVVWQQTGSSFLVACMTLLRLAPMGLFGALVGVLADRVERHGALVAVLLVQAAAVGALAVLALTGTPGIWQIALACFLGGFGWATDNPVRRMMLGDLLGAARMGTATSLDVMANNASRILGPALGGTLLAAFGPGQAFAACVLLYLLAIWMALRVRHRMHPARARRGPVIAEMAEGFRAALRLPALRGLLLVTVVFNLFAWPFLSMIPVIGRQSLDLGPSAVGWLASMDGFGALAGALAMALVSRPDRHARLYLGGCMLYMTMLTLFALAPSPVLAGVALMLVGFGGAAFVTMQATLTYLLAPPELRSRAFGVLSVASGTGLIGFLHLGLLAEAIGAAAATAVMGAEGLVALALTRRHWRRLLA